MPGMDTVDTLPFPTTDECEIQYHAVWAGRIVGKMAHRADDAIRVAGTMEAMIATGFKLEPLTEEARVLIALVEAK